MEAVRAVGRVAVVAVVTVAVVAVAVKEAGGWCRRRWRRWRRGRRGRCWQHWRKWWCPTYLLPTPHYGRTWLCFFSRSAYIWSALSRSISMMVSRRRSSSCLSFSMTFFSVHCGRRGREGGGLG